MRIAIDLTSLADNFSGIERFAANIALAMIEQDGEDEFTLIFKDAVHTLFGECVRRRNVDTVIVASNGKSKLYVSQITLPKQLKAIQSDVYLFLAFPAPYLFSSNKALSTVHDLSCLDCPETMTAKSGLYWRVLDRRAAKRQPHVLTISEFSKSRIVHHYGISPERVSVIYCGIDRDEFSSGHMNSEARARLVEKYALPDRFILSLSTLEPRKNLRLLIDAWAHLKSKSLLEEHLVLAGRKGWKLDELFSSLPEGIKGEVHVTGFVDDEDLPSLYSMADLFVSPSIYEGFGMPPLEARVAGAKVLCSDILCHQEIFGNTVRYFKSNDCEDLENQILRALESPDCSPLGSDLYHWDTEAGKLLTMLHKDY